MPVNYYRYRTEWGGLMSAWARAWPSRSSIIPFHMKPESLISLAAQLEAWALEIKNSGQRLPMSTNALAQILARVDQRFSQQMSAGPVDPRQQNPNAAWKIPVRRITSHYYHGWYVRRVAPGVWMVYNPTREAYYIEYGIHTSQRRVRRPIRKMALLKTLKFADSHQVGQFVWETVFGPLRRSGARTQRGFGSVRSSPQSPGVMRFL